jgi:nitrite reductase/ring-hydroxylating ferredoxin subunit/uncharacterized membrane protein
MAAQAINGERSGDRFGLRQQLSVQDVVDAIGREAWLDRLGDTLQQAVTAGLDVFGTQSSCVANALHGTWLGHPLHPLLTDVAIGGWTTAITLDLVDQVVGDEVVAAGADGALGLGLLGALGAGATGANDWQHTNGASRRVGVAHALLNISATTLFVGSLLARLTDHRSLGRWLARLGFAVSTTSAYLGGHLVFGHQIGVNHAAGHTGPDAFTPAMPEADLQEGTPRLAEVDGTRVVLLLAEGQIYALAETCSHLGGPLSEGALKNGGIVCPWHGSRFALADGRVLDGPATFPVPCLETRIHEGQIEVRART